MPPIEAKQKIGQRKHEKAEDKVAKSVDEVEKTAADDPRPHPIKTYAEGKNSDGRVKNSEKEAVQAANDGIDHGARRARKPLRYQHRGTEEQSPDI